uniref:Uncharacterized protein n=1 Tax=Podarcis muralis TaxID=64176 RepID=A0A670II01_PODMU
MEVPQLDLLESPEGCPSPLELKSAPSKKMWVKLRALYRWGAIFFFFAAAINSI